MGVFDKFSENQLQEAEGFGRTPNMDVPGRYEVRILRHQIGTSRVNANKIKFVCDYEILKGGNKKHPNGSHRAYVVMLDPGDKAKTSSKLGAIKLHLSAITGIPQSEIDKKFLDKLEARPLLLEGKKVVLEIGEQIKLKDGNPFTPQNWYPLTEVEDGMEEGETEGVPF